MMCKEEEHLKLQLMQQIDKMVKGHQKNWSYSTNRNNISTDLLSTPI